MFTDPSQSRLSTNSPDEDPQRQTGLDAASDTARELDREEDPVFAQEQEHLNRTYETLVKMAASFAAKIKKLDAEVAADKEMLADELTGNFASMGEAFETYAEY
ncbi:MAG: DNA helicase, partial [Slackia sp.]|nr:DNA helicase [Slackia sp.]